MELLYWHWIILGSVLVLFELIIPSFTAMWFGLGAIIVGALLWVYPEITVGWQVLIWALVSAGLTYFWFRVFKPKKHQRPVLRNEVEGMLALVIRPATEHTPGMLRFSSPLLGEDEWPFMSDQGLEAGQQVLVSDVQDNILIVSKRS